MCLDVSRCRHAVDKIDSTLEHNCVSYPKQIEGANESVLRMHSCGAKKKILSNTNLKIT